MVTIGDDDAMVGGRVAAMGVERREGARTEGPPGGAGPVWDDYRDIEEDVRSGMSYEGPTERERVLLRQLAAAKRQLEERAARADEPSPRRTLASFHRPETVLKVLQRWLPANGYFTGRDVTRYLRNFELGLRMGRPTGDELIEAFEMTADLRVASKVAQVRQESRTWAEFKRNVRDAFVNQDETRTTAASFQAWIEGPKDGSIEDVLADFELKYDELSDEERAMFADRPLYFSTCLPEEHRLIFLEPLCRSGRLVATWERVRERVRVRRRGLVCEAGSPPGGWGDASRVGSRQRESGDWGECDARTGVGSGKRGGRARLPTGSHHADG